MMRHWIVVASLAATLTLLISTPVLARTTMHGGGHAVSHPHQTMVGSRFVFISDARFGNHFLSFDRFSRRFDAVPRRQFDRFDGVDGFGDLGGEWGPGRWADDGSALTSAYPPAGEFGALPPPAPRSPAELPPCHEATSLGVVIERGSGCTH
jgi:hypothetical protein